MSAVFRCDRCGKLFQTRNMTLVKMSCGITEADLCNACVNELNDFMKGKQVASTKTTGA